MARHGFERECQSKSHQRRGTSDAGDGRCATDCDSLSCFLSLAARQRQPLFQSCKKCLASASAVPVPRVGRDVLAITHLHQPTASAANERLSGTRDGSLDG